MKKVNSILMSIEQMRPMPTSVTRIMHALDEPNSTGSLIADLIGLDQALAASVMQMANSAAMGSSVNCTSLPDAVMRLGFKRIRTMIMGIGASGPLTHRLSGYRLGAGELWNHSVATAVAAQWLAQAVRYPNPEEAYVAGLLHDMGKLVLDQFVAVDYSRMMDIMQSKKRSLWQVEEDLIGMDHGRVGGLMAEKWRFPPLLSDAIQFHHAPSLANAHEELPAIINIANSFTTPLAHGLVDYYGHIAHPEALRILNIPEPRLETLRTTITGYMLRGNLDG